MEERLDARSSDLSNEGKNLSVTDQNRLLNKERIGFFSFLSYASKGEMAFDQFQGILFWNSLLEFFIFFVCFVLFCSYPSQMWRNMFFIFHAIRGVIALMVLKNLPTTSKVIENLENFENDSLQNIQSKIYSEYKNLLKKAENKIRSLMYVYWLLTLFNFLLDFIIFCVLLSEWGKIQYNFKNIATLVCIVILFVNNISMATWFFSLKYYLPDEMSSAIIRATIFESKSLAKTIGDTVKRKFFSQIASSNANNA